jgi:hypothetical protein
MRPNATYSYHNIVAQYWSAANYHYDAIAEMPYLANASAFGPSPGCNFLSYQDAQSIAAKGASPATTGWQRHVYPLTQPSPPNEFGGEGLERFRSSGRGLCAHSHDSAGGSGL